MLGQPECSQGTHRVRPLSRARPLGLICHGTGAAARSTLAALVLSAARCPYHAVVARALPRCWGRWPFALAALGLRRRAPSRSNCSRTAGCVVALLRAHHAAALVRRLVRGTWHSVLPAPGYSAPGGHGSPRVHAALGLAPCAAARTAVAAPGLGAVRRCRCRTEVLGRPLPRRCCPRVPAEGSAAPRARTPCLPAGCQLLYHARRQEGFGAIRPGPCSTCRTGTPGRWLGRAGTSAGRCRYRTEALGRPSPHSCRTALAALDSAGSVSRS